MFNETTTQARNESGSSSLQDFAKHLATLRRTLLRTSRQLFHLKWRRAELRRLARQSSSRRRYDKQVNQVDEDISELETRYQQLHLELITLEWTGRWNGVDMALVEAPSYIRFFRRILGKTPSKHETLYDENLSLGHKIKQLTKDLRSLETQLSSRTRGSSSNIEPLIEQNKAQLIDLEQRQNIAEKSLRKAYFEEKSLAWQARAKKEKSKFESSLDFRRLQIANAILQFKSYCEKSELNKFQRSSSAIHTFGQTLQHRLGS